LDADNTSGCGKLVDPVSAAAARREAAAFGNHQYSGDFFFTCGDHRGDGICLSVNIMRAHRVLHVTSGEDLTCGREHGGTNVRVFKNTCIRASLPRGFGELVPRSFWDGYHFHVVQFRYFEDTPVTEDQITELCHEIKAF
jgi:hypothetical protein